MRLARLDEPPYAPDGGRARPRRRRGLPEGDSVADEADVEPADDGAGAEDAPEDEISSVVEPTSLEEPAGGRPVEDLPEAGRPSPAMWPPRGPTRPGPPAPGARRRRRGRARRWRRWRSPPARPSRSTGAILVGRAPEPGRHPSTGQPRLVAVPSPQQEISSTHLEVRPGVGADHGSAVVTDLGSTNGTVLVQPGLPPEDLLAGVTGPLVPGRSSTSATA